MFRNLNPRRLEMARACSTYGRIQKCIENFSGKTEGKIPLGRARSRWEGNIKIDLRAVDCDPGD